MVASWDPAHPCRPKVVRICEGAAEDILRDDPDGAPEFITLSEHEDLTIAECDGFDVSEDNYDLGDVAIPEGILPEEEDLSDAA